MRWKKFNLVQRFSVLSAVSICGLSVTLGLLIANLTERHMVSNDVRATTEFIRHEIDELFADSEPTTSELQRNIGQIIRISDLLLLMPEIERVKVYNAQQEIIWSNERLLIGRKFPDNANVNLAMTGKVVTEIEKPKKAEHIFERDFKKVFEIYVPVLDKEGRAMGVIETYKVPRGMWATVRKLNLLIWLVASIGGGLLYLSLYSVVVRAYRKQVWLEGEIGESERFLSTIYNAIGSIITVIDTDFKIIHANHVALKIFGQDVIGSLCYAALRGADSPCPDCPSRKTLMDKEGVCRVIYNQKFAKYWDARSYPVLRKDGEMRCMVEIMSDITDRQMAEEAVQHSLEKLRKALGGIIQAMAHTVEAKDPYTAGHQRRVAELARAIATEMGLSREHIDALRMAASIHDLGKLTVPGEVLSKPGKISEIEFLLIKCHPQAGYDILKEIEFPWPVAQIVLQHHERMDGSGYPLGLLGEDILIEARILGVADVVESVSSHRPYRPALGVDKALGEIAEKRGLLYDPLVVDCCLKLFIEKKFTLSEP